ncbi:MAG: hypothetical protein KKF12_22825 [Proteobacteria bacterium]|nr:hypothetical protein [Pseudomonadota bacterium]
MENTMPDLSGFSGTQNYWRWTPVSPIFLTDGVKYLTDELNAGWLISSAEHFLTTRKKIKDSRHIIEIQLEVKANGNALMTLENEFGVYAKRKFSSTNFPSEGIGLWAYPYDRNWIIMLQSEY